MIFTLDQILLTLVLLALLAVIALVLTRTPQARLDEATLALLREQGRAQQQLCASVQAMQQAAARSDGALAHLTQQQGQQLRELNQSSQEVMGELRESLEMRLAQSLAEARSTRQELQQTLAQQLGQQGQAQAQQAEQLRATLNERLDRIQRDNAARLDAMRQTVDEKLHATLEQRLGESFRLVSERLEQVHRGLGEMQTLAGSVGDLKRMMTNVKTRGTWGELQLGAIIDNVLTPEQYARNVKTVPGSNDLVEFAIRLPGKTGEQPVWLPIDAKYPVEHYQRLMDALECADKAAIVQAGNGLEASIRHEAKKIRAKYVAPPYTTDFAVLYLPSEGLFAEVMRRPGLVEAVQNEWRVMLCGPANLAAMLNSLQMGFKTLAIEKRSSEVWAVLGQVKTEFGKFGEVVEATRKSIDAAARKFEQVDVRTRAIRRRLADVHEQPGLEDGSDDGQGAGESAALPGAAGHDASAMP